MKITRKKKPNNYLASFTDHLTEQYGKPGTPTREEFEEGIKTFKLGVMLQELRKGKGLAKALTKKS